MRTLLLAVLGVTGLLVACSPCNNERADPITVSATSLCTRSDAGTITVGAPFTIFANHNVSGSATCVVGVDGGSIQLTLTATPSGGGCGVGGPGIGAPALPAPQPAACAIPALDAGTYAVNTTTPSSLTLPYDGGIDPCTF